MQHLFIDDERVVFATAKDSQASSLTSLPDNLNSQVAGVLKRAGVSALYAFQNEAITHLLNGTNVVLSGGTGSGKSLCYQAAILDRLRAPTGTGLDTRKSTALYISPTKALAQDQARRLRALGADWAIPRLYDGDTPANERAIVRRTANLLLTNPDMLSAGILPAHSEWSTFISGLDYVVIDESHIYRGVFGSHVAQVIRRLRRLCSYYGNTSVTFCCVSATTADPAGHAAALTGLAYTVVGDSGAPQPGRDIVLWNPAFDEEEDSRDSALGDASRIYARLLEDEISTIVFARTRKACELIHTFTADYLHSRQRDDLVARIAPYRAGYTPEQRRATERALADGSLLGVVSTSALELGIDVGSLDASISVTFPGTMTSLRQQWGRAGRTKRGLNLLIAGNDALDQFYMDEPQLLASTPLERAIISLDNLRIVTPHVAAAAAELPLVTATDGELFGPALAEAVASLRQYGEVVDAPAGIAYVGRDHPAGSISLRSAGDGDIVIVEQGTGQMLGTVEIGRAASSVYPGAVYLHRGESYFVTELDYSTRTAHVDKRSLPFYTLPKFDTDISVIEALEAARGSGDHLRLFGRVTVSDQHTGFQRKDRQTQREIDDVQQLLPPTTFDTEAIWWPAPVQLVREIESDRLMGALHAAEHALISMLPVLAMCDRWDIGGLSIDWHDAFSGPGVFVYDGHPGGIGLTRAGFDNFDEWLHITLTRLRCCPCSDGCPACIQSPKCGNLNEPLDKDGAITTLSIIGGGI